MLFKHYFKNNLGGKGPPKTLTHRNWTDLYADPFLKALDQGLWIRAWIGQWAGSSLSQCTSPAQAT